MRYAPRDIYSHAEEYIAHCRRHACSSRMAALRIGFWGLKRALFPRDAGLKKKSEFSDERLHIAFVLEGGIGDTVVNANYIENFIRLAACPVAVDIYAGQEADVLNGIFRDKTYVSALVGDNPLQYAYDAVIGMLFVPRLLCADEGRLNALGSERLNACLSDMQRFAKTFPEWVDSRSRNFAGLLGYARLRGLTRNRLASAGNMEEEFDENLFSLSAPPITPEVLSRFPFLDAPFIAVNRSVGPSGESTKLWSVPQYGEVLEEVRGKYPGVLLVRMGGCQGDELGCDVSLCGQTDFVELMTLLKRAKLLVSNEGGLVHLRHFLRAGPSLVLFGSSDSRLYAYSENENRTHGCSCEWLHHNWQNFCIKNYAEFAIH